MENKIGLIWICTGRYDMFLQPLLESADKFFFSREKYDIYLFTDKPQISLNSDRATIYIKEIPHLPFPLPTLYRYKWMSENKDWFKTKNLFYMDVDMLFVNNVDDEILPDSSGLVVTYHPGFYTTKGWGDNGTHPHSTAYVAPHLRHDYFAGGFQGGSNFIYLLSATLIAQNIEEDSRIAKLLRYRDNNGILARWHDESHWNAHLKYHPYKALTPEYCMVEEMELRKKWGIDNITPRIIALKKDHKALRT